MNTTNNRKLTGNAQSLRKNMTKEERHLWYDYLKHLPVTVHRQKVIGPHIADFYIASCSLVIELDGSQHYEEENKAADLQRDTYFAQQGIRVLHIPNNAVKENFTGVCEEIYDCVYPAGRQR